MFTEENEMERRISMYMIVLAIMLISATHNGHAAIPSVEWNGYFHADNRVELAHDHRVSWYEYRLDLQAEYRPFDDARLFSEFWIRSLGLPSVESSADLTETGNIQLWNVTMRELYFDLYGFPWRACDIRIGRQRIAWGVGDEVSIVDNINPIDLEDIWDFGRRAGSDAVQFSFFFGNHTIEGVYVPIFVPAVLPYGQASSAIFGSIQAPSSIQLRTVTDSIRMPEHNISEEITGALRYRTSLSGYDWAFSYVYGRDYVPIPCTLRLSPTTNPGEADAYSTLIYPRLHIAGAELSGEVFGLGAWAEVAMFVPEEVDFVLDLSGFGLGVSDSIILPGDPYFKWLAGVDYTFPNGFYVNLQYVHGFIHERGDASCKDYVLFGCEWYFFRRRLKLMPCAGCLEIDDITDIENCCALVFNPLVSYKPIDNVELTGGIRLIEGGDATIFGSMKEQDEFFLRVKYSF
jgi:hypothetical protein